MNEFFDKLGAAARRTVNTVSTDVSILAHEQKLREHYQAIGKLYCQYVSSGLIPEGDEFEEKLAAVAAELQRISQLKAHKEVVD